MAAFTFTAQRGLSLLGDEKGAWMADTVAETVVGGELVTDGVFATACGVNWTCSSGWTIGSGVASCNGTSGDIYDAVAAVAGLTYLVSVEITAYTSGNLRLNNSVGVFAGNNQNMNSVGVHVLTVIAFQAGDLALFSDLFNGSIGNVSMRLADPDLSTNANGGGIYGSLIKSAVATGADLMGWSNFSASNYWEQPYNSDLDFGTGDFCVMGWLKQTANNQSTQNPIQLGQSAGYSINILRESSSGDEAIQFQIDGATASTGVVGSSKSMSTGEWVFFALIRLSNVFYLFIDGVIDVTDSTNVGSLSPVAADTTKIGFGDLTVTGAEIDVALVRAFAYAPTAAQIKSIYNKEKHLFKKYSTYTQEGEDYQFDLVLSALNPSSRAIRTDNVSLGGQVETILDRTDEEVSVSTDLMHRTDTSYVLTSQFDEFIYSTQASEEFTMDVYGTVVSEDEPEAYFRLDTNVNKARQGDVDLFTAQFRARKVP